MVAIPVQENPVTTAMYEAASGYERGPKRHYLGMSNIGKSCPRSLWYAFRGYTPSAIDGRAKMIFSLGDRVEDEVVRWLEMAGYKVTDRQRDFTELNGFFRGHWDGCIEGVTRRPHVLEVKSANANRFKAYKANGVRKISPEYYCQVQCYMGYAGLERALFVVMCKDNCELFTERVYFSKADFQALENRAREIICCNDPATLGRDESHCEWCNFRFRCQPDENPYVQKTRTCGTCHWCHADPDCTMHCLECGRKIVNWGLSCEKWLYADERDRVPF